jgi:transposase
VARDVQDDKESDSEEGAMGGMTPAIAWQETADELYAGYCREQDLERRKRRQALWLMREGKQVQEAARAAGVGRRTLTRWLTWYREGGLEAVLRRVPGYTAVGVPARLSAEQQAALLDRARVGEFRTYGEAGAWVEREYGVHYRYHGIYSLLSRRGIHPKVPRPTAAKGDPATREAWKKGGSAQR